MKFELKDIDFIDGFYGLYAVDNLGNVWKIGRTKKPYILTPKTNHKGYLRVFIMIKGKKYFLRIHRLVAQAFIPNPDNKPQVNHKNGIKTDNRVENLEWVSNEENYLHALKNNLYKKSKPIPVYTFINGEKVSFKNITQASKTTGVNYSYICNNIRCKILRHRKWFIEEAPTY